MNTIIAVDVGTTHIKSILFEEFGEVIHTRKHATPLRDKNSGPCYDPEEIWQIVKKQIQDLVAAYGKKPVGISITGMAEAGLIVNKDTKEPLTDILPWFDERTMELAEGMDTHKEKELFARTGLRNSFKYGIYKFLWLMKRHGFKSEHVVWLSMCDYMVLRLTGELVTDPTFASRTYVYDIRKHNWDEKRIRDYGLRKENFPRVLDSGEIAGNYRGIPVAVAGHDHILAAFGLFFHDREKIIDSAGTSETYIGVLKNGRITYDSGLLYGPYVDGGYFYMANIPSSGHSVEWFRKKLQMTEIGYEEMNERLLGLKREPTGILYLPYLTGMGAPWYQGQLQGALLGITPYYGGTEILKGMIEGIQYQAKWLLSIVMENHGIDGKHLICAGGGTNNEVMMQIKSDILNAAISVPNMNEATLTGAAALFLYKNMGFQAADIFLQKTQIEKVYLPDKKIVEQYDIIYRKKFLPLIETLAMNTL